MRRVLLLASLLTTAAAFSPAHHVAIVSRTAAPSNAFSPRPAMTSLNLLDPTMAMDAIVSAAPQAQDFLASSGEAFFGSDILTAFTDQGQNLAGIFFQASLLPYLLFLYFLSFKANRIPETANFGFQYLLLFVLSTIPSGIITMAVYGTSLANVDWLHGGAESLLTVANILVVRSLVSVDTLSCSEPCRAAS